IQLFDVDLLLFIMPLIPIQLILLLLNSCLSICQQQSIFLPNIIPPSSIIQSEQLLYFISQFAPDRPYKASKPPEQVPNHPAADNSPEPPPAYVLLPDRSRSAYAQTLASPFRPHGSE